VAAAAAKEAVADKDRVKVKDIVRVKAKHLRVALSPRRRLPPDRSRWKPTYRSDPVETVSSPAVHPQVSMAT
jgi:hypothetical protein